MLLLISCKKENDITYEPEPELIFHLFKGWIGANDNSTIVSDDDKLIICGSSGEDFLILKITDNGDEIWRKVFYAGNSSWAESLVQGLYSDLFVCGYTRRNYPETRADILLVKTDAMGDTIWTKTYGGADDDYGRNIIATSDSCLLLAGKTESFGAGTFGDIYLLKVDFNGDTLWTKRYPDPEQEVPFSLLETSDGGYLITGTNEDNSGPRQLLLLKVSSTGDVLWRKIVGDQQSWHWGYSTVEAANGDLVSCGSYNPAYLGYSNALVLKTDQYGNILWQKEYGDEFLSEKGYAIRPNIDETYTVTGSSYDVNTMQDDIIVFRIDSDGNQEWYKRFGSSGSDWGINLVKGADNLNIITGNYNVDTSNTNIFMTKIDDESNFR